MVSLLKFAPNKSDRGRGGSATHVVSCYYGPAHQQQKVHQIFNLIFVCVNSRVRSNKMRYMRSVSDVFNVMGNILLVTTC